MMAVRPRVLSRICKRICPMICPEIEICPEMQHVLDQYADLSVDRRASPQSLAMLKLGAKKRKKTEKKPLDELVTKIKQL